MKYIVLLFTNLLIAFAFNSCIKDRSNYNYSEAEKITVTGIQSAYTVVSEKEKLTITPTSTSNKANAEFEYLWGIYETSVQGFAPVLDTIGRQKDLDYFVQQPAKTWVLVYRVTNKKTGYAAYFTSTINVITEFTRGWYVAKDDGTNADLDLFLTPTTIVPESVNENVYSKVNGSKLSGKANFLTFFSSYKSLANGTTSPANTRTLILTSENDVAAMNINTLRNIRTSSDIFYEAPPVTKPAQVFPGSSAYYFFNNGQLHTIYNMSTNTGRFGARVLKDASNSDYNLSKYFMTYFLVDPLFFDEVSSSFYSMVLGSGTSMTATTTASGSEMAPNNNNKNMLYMGTKAVSSSTLTGIAIFQDKTDPTLKMLATITYPSNKQVRIMNDTLLPTDRLYNASHYTVLNGDENLFYFVVGQEVWSRNLSNNFEKLEYTIPAGEELTYIRHKKYSVTADAAFAYNYIIIATKVGARYKVRMFQKSSGSISGEPKVILEGDGIARDVFYVSPSVFESTHLLTY